jgi:hypothetical protein
MSCTSPSLPPFFSFSFLRVRANPFLFISFRSRGVKAEFANPLYNLSPTTRARGRLPLEHPDYSPPLTCKPTLLFPEAHRRAKERKSEKEREKEEERERGLQEEREREREKRGGKGKGGRGTLDEELERAAGGKKPGSSVPEASHRRTRSMDKESRLEKALEVERAKHRRTTTRKLPVK